jgi:hypothetical protein
MPELSIYDSEGNPVAKTGARTNERVQDFFFDGVRLSIDTTGQGLEMVAFFRARDSQASRSEQYYALFQSDSVTDISRFGRMVTKRVEDELDKTLETSTDDTEMFRTLRSFGTDDATLPGDPNTQSDILELVEEGTGVTVGVRTGRNALTLMDKVLREQRRVKTAVADRPDSSSLTDYDLVVDVGQHQGLAPLGDTERRLEELRERRRQRLQPDYMQEDDGRDPVALASLGVAVIGVLLLLVYGACSLSGPLPVLGSLPLPGVDCGGAAGPADGGGQVTVKHTYTANITGASWDETSADTTTLRLQGELTNMTTVTNGTDETTVTNGTELAMARQNVTVRIVSQTGNWRNETNVTGDGSVTVAFSNVTREPVNATLIWENQNLTANASIDENGTLGNARPGTREIETDTETSPTGAETPTDTETSPTGAETPTDTETPNPATTGGTETPAAISAASARLRRSGG